MKRATNKATPPDWLLATPTSKIDSKTLEISTLPLGDWLGKYAADDSGQFKSPKTGAYTMVNIITCSKCGKQIPNVPIPPEVLRLTDPLQIDEATAKLRSAYVCPYCKKNPF